ncbi:MAG: hypothetical protein J5I93_00435 [Pirellulaceae bacterium]|nr:hypothetical protein [Pirellulaceae bacterium]
MRSEQSSYWFRASVRFRAHTRFRNGFLLLVLSVWGLTACGGELHGQDPFGGGPMDPFEARQPGSAPAAAPPFGQPPAAGAAGGEDVDPVVQAIRDWNPQTAEQLTRAMQAMLDHGRPDEALQYLKRILAANPGVPELAKLNQEFGSAMFMRLRRDGRVQPEGQQLADRVLSAAQQWSQDPTRLAGLVRQLSDASAERRVAALTDLRSAGLAAVNPILAVLRDPARGSEHANLRQALVELGGAFAAPLLAVLESDDAALKSQIIEVLGRLESRAAIPLLIQPAVDGDEDSAVTEAAQQALRRIVGAMPTRLEARHFLEHEVRRLLELSAAPDRTGSVEFWQWDAAGNQVVRLRVSAAEAAVVLAARLADDLFQLDSENADYRRLNLLANLEAAKRLGGLDQALAEGPGTAHAKAAAAGVAAVEDVLHEAIRQRSIGAAIGAAEVLGEIAGPELLSTSSASPSLLLDALRHPNRRLRYAAAMAIMKLNPQQRYAGSSFLVETLGNLASTTGQPRALVIHPREEFGQSLAGLLREVGYEADAVQTGHQALLAADRQPDYELVLISPEIDGPAYKEVVQLLRRNPRTASLPVGILARPEQLEAARQLADQDPLLRAFPRPHDAATIAFVIGDLLAVSPADRIPQETRQQQAAAALDALLTLARDPQRYGFYDLQRQQPQVEMALHQPALRERAAELLGLLGSPAAQRALVELASQHALPAEARQAAVQAFQHAVAERRLLLTTGEILRQYERYNQSATLDQATQQILGAILDVIESRWRAEQQALATQGQDAEKPPGSLD